MPCCQSTIFAGSSALSDLQYTPAMAALYGPLPKIDVAYMNEAGDYVFAGVFTQVQFNGDRILIDHGGPAKWIARIS